MSKAVKLFCCLFLLLLCGRSRAIAQETTQRTLSVHQPAELEDVMLSPLPWPESLEAPDIQEPIGRGDFEACEEMLLDVLPQAANIAEAEAAVYNALGSFAIAQANASSSEEEEARHLNRAAGYFSKGGLIANSNPVKLKLHRAHLLYNDADLLDRLGKEQEALLKTEQLLYGFEGIGTGSRRDALSSMALQRAVKLRRELGQNSDSIASFLEPLTNHTSKVVALLARKELINLQLHAGDIAGARNRLDQMKSEYAGKDSVGHVSAVRIIQLFEGMIEAQQESGIEVTPHEH